MITNGKRANWIWKACSHLGLTAEFDFKLKLKDGIKLFPVARILELGAPNGMLIFTSYDPIERFTEQIIDADYGFSILDEPRSDAEFDLESFREMFLDWGWSGNPARKPGWMMV